MSILNARTLVFPLIQKFCFSCKEVLALKLVSIKSWGLEGAAHLTNIYKVTYIPTTSNGGPLDPILIVTGLPPSDEVAVQRQGYASMNLR